MIRNASSSGLGGNHREASAFVSPTDSELTSSWLIVGNARSTPQRRVSLAAAATKTMMHLEVMEHPNVIIFLGASSLIQVRDTPNITDIFYTSGRYRPLLTPFIVL